MPRIYRFLLDVSFPGELVAASVMSFPDWGQPADYTHVLPPGWVLEHTWTQVLDELMERALDHVQPELPFEEDDGEVF